MILINLHQTTFDSIFIAPIKKMFLTIVPLILSGRIDLLLVPVGWCKGKCWLFLVGGLPLFRMNAITWGPDQALLLSFYWKYKSMGEHEQPGDFQQVNSHTVMNKSAGPVPFSLKRVCRSGSLHKMIISQTVDLFFSDRSLDKPQVTSLLCYTSFNSNHFHQMNCHQNGRNVRKTLACHELQINVCKWNALII